MRGFSINIERATKDNEDFRRVLFTTHNTQVVVMSLMPGEDIGEEMHGVDQFLRCEEGSGKSVLDGLEQEFSGGIAVVVPAGTKHNVINTSMDRPMKLYTVYAPPHHVDGKVHATKAESQADENNDHFEGKTTV
ncbi:MAG: cupin domain-containing protein [Candidatus Pacebacteria bacterium]|nr:cupin domain-containing protein [Candidatus Paceibacterota bacterium]